MGCRQCFPLSVVQLKGKHCRKPHCRNGVVVTFGLSSTNSSVISFYCKFNVYIFDQVIWVIGAQKAPQFWICYFYTTPLLKYFLTNWDTGKMNYFHCVTSRASNVKKYHICYDNINRKKSSIYDKTFLSSGPAIRLLVLRKVGLIEVQSITLAMTQLSRHPTAHYHLEL